jgi:hypothetical protein
MRALDDILIGFLLFFAIDRTVSLFSKNVVQPWAEVNSKDKNMAENWKLVAELLCLIFAAFMIYKYRKVFQKIDNS